MAKRKRVRRKTARRVRRVSRRPAKLVGGKRKFALVVKNLILFTALALISFVLTYLLTNEVLNNLFLISSMVFGFVAVAFLITLLILLILKAFKK